MNFRAFLAAIYQKPTFEALQRLLLLMAAGKYWSPPHSRHSERQKSRVSNGCFQVRCGQNKNRTNKPAKPAATMTYMTLTL